MRVLHLYASYKWTGPADLARGFARLAAPWNSQPAAPTAGILALGSPAWVVAGADIVLEGLDLAAGTDPALCEVRRGEGLWQPVEARLERDTRRAPGRLWSVRLADVREDFRWRFRRGSIVSAERSPSTAARYSRTPRAIPRSPTEAASGPRGLAR